MPMNIRMRMNLRTVLEEAVERGVSSRRRCFTGTSSVHGKGGLGGEKIHHEIHGLPASSGCVPVI